MSRFIHDNFDGSMHCRECKGPCALSGDAKVMTELVRNVCEFFALGENSRLPPQIEEPLAKLVSDFPLFYQHARKAVEPIVKARRNA